jgi:death-on-curing protein
VAQGDGGQVEDTESYEASLASLATSTINLHELILKESGGVHGVNAASLYAALARPFASAYGEFVYSTPYEMAAAVFHAVICDHVFTDGNKRTATLLAMYFLAGFKVIDNSQVDELKVRMLGDVALETAKGNVSVEQVTDWLRRIFDPEYTPPTKKKKKRRK